MTGDDLYFLGDKNPGSYVYAIAIDNKRTIPKIAIYLTYIFNDGTVQVGYPSCKLSLAEFASMMGFTQSIMCELESLLEKEK